MLSTGRLLGAFLGGLGTAWDVCDTAGLEDFHWDLTNLVFHFPFDLQVTHAIQLPLPHTQA